MKRIILFVCLALPLNPSLADMRDDPWLTKVMSEFEYLQEEGEDVRPLEHLPALDDFIDGLLEELELAHWVLFDSMQELYLAPDDGPQSSSMLLRLVVIVVALEIKHVLF